MYIYTAIYSSIPLVHVGVSPQLCCICTHLCAVDVPGDGIFNGNLNGVHG